MARRQTLGAIRQCAWRHPVHQVDDGVWHGRIAHRIFNMPNVLQKCGRTILNGGRRLLNNQHIQ